MHQGYKYLGKLPDLDPGTRLVLSTRLPLLRRLRIRLDRRRPRALSDAHCRALCERLRGVHRLIFQWALCTGLRTSSLVTVPLKNFTSLLSSRSSPRLLEVRAKGGKTVSVHVPQPLVEATVRYIEIERVLSSRSRQRAAGTTLFLNSRGQPVTSKAYLTTTAECVFYDPERCREDRYDFARLPLPPAIAGMFARALLGMMGAVRVSSRRQAWRQLSRFARFLCEQPEGIERTLFDPNVLARYRIDLSKDRVGAMTLSIRFHLVRRVLAWLAENGDLSATPPAEFRLPLLIGLFGFVALEAVVQNKAVSLIVVAAALLFRSRTVPFGEVIAHASIVVTLLGGSLLGAWFGADLATRLSHRAFYRVIAMLLLGIAVLLLFAHEPSTTGEPLLSGIFQTVAGVASGFAIGVVASFLGVAGGELPIPTLVPLFGLEIKRVLSP